MKREILFTISNSVQAKDYYIPKLRLSNDNLMPQDQK